MMPQERCQKSREKRVKGGYEVCFPLRWGFGLGFFMLISRCLAAQSWFLKTVVAIQLPLPLYCISYGSGIYMSNKKGEDSGRRRRSR